jgi:3-oxoadipate enol-lactonase
MTMVRNVLSASPLPDEMIVMLATDIMKGNTYASAAWPVYAMLEDIVAEVKRSRVPVLVVAAELDKLEPIERLRSEALENFVEADTDLVVVKGSGHLLPVEAPLEVSKYIEGFVRKVAV